MEADKFLYLRESATEGVLIAQDGGFAHIYHNEEHIVGQVYGRRIEARHLKKSFKRAYEIAIEETKHCTTYDFPEYQQVIPCHLEKLADDLTSFKGDLFNSLIVFDYSEHEIEDLEKDEHVAVFEFLDNPIFKEQERSDLINELKEYDFKRNLKQGLKDTRFYQVEKLPLERLRKLVDAFSDELRYYKELEQ